MKKATFAVAAAAGLMSVGVAQATELKMATIFPAGSVWGKSIQTYVDRVAELSDGELTIVPYWGAQLGNDNDTLNMMLRGRLDIWSGPASSLSVLSPASTALGLPFVFHNDDHLICVIEEVSEDLSERIESRGHVINYFPVGWVDVTAKDALRSPQDFSGVKTRTSVADVSTGFWNAVGAQAVPLVYGEVNQGLATNLLEAAETVLPIYASGSTYGVAPVYIGTNHYYNVGSWVVSSRTWQSLSEEEQAILTEAREAIPFAQQVSDLLAVQKTIREKLVAENGVTFIDLTEEERGVWQAVGLAAQGPLAEGLSDEAKDFFPAVQAAGESCLQ